LRATDGGLKKRKHKSKKLSQEGKAKTISPMNYAIQLEDKVSRSRSKHEGDPRRQFATG
jgi:hypothetical protein